jgi:hypothetical protein
MEITDFLKKLKYSKKLIQLGGFEYLINKWENMVDHIPYDNHYQFDDYLHELYNRKIIQEIQENCVVDINTIDRIAQIDSLFKIKTIKVNSLFPTRSEKDVPPYWFFYRVPLERIPDWYSSNSNEMRIYLNHIALP